MVAVGTVDPSGGRPYALGLLQASVDTPTIEVALGTLAATRAGTRLGLAQAIRMVLVGRPPSLPVVHSEIFGAGLILQSKDTNGSQYMNLGKLLRSYRPLW